jgi:rhodanese-related sulfurtransferase
VPTPKILPEKQGSAALPAYNAHTGSAGSGAAKILIDKGFERITNMRHGIVDWVRRKHPVVK